MTGRAHSIFAPSTSEVWVNCHASVKLCAKRGINDPSPDSEEGEAAHWVLERIVTGQSVKEEDTAPNGVEVTEEMIDGAHLAAKYLQSLPGNSFFSGVEVPLTMPRIRPEMFGWSDVAAYWRHLQLMEVVDYKFGWRIVDPFRNWQLISYLVGMMDKFQINGLADQFLTVRLTVIQPRPYHKDGPIRTWECKASDLRGFINQLIAAAEAAMGDNPQYYVSDLCEHCPGRHDCPKLAAEGWKYADRADAYDPPLDALPEAQGRELVALQRAIRILNARVSGLESAMTVALRKGQRVKGWEMGQVAGKLRWNESPEVVEMTAAAMGVSLAKPTQLMTPTQAKAVLPEEVVDAMASRSVKMVLRQTDTELLKRIFGK